MVESNNAIREKKARNVREILTRGELRMFILREEII